MRKRSHLFAALLGSSIVAALALNEIRFNTPSFDGALNLQVPVSLATSGRYETTYRSVDELVLQSGPTLLLPIALSFRVAGVSNLTAQLPNVIYLAGLCALLMLVACRYGGLLAGVSALLLVLATRGLLDLGLRVYGEIPALCFFAVALVLLIEWEERPGGRRMAFLVGLGLGCSVLTKTVMLLALLAILVTFALGALAGLRRPRPSEAAWFAAGVVLPLAAFEAFKLAHAGSDGYAAWWRLMVPAIGQQGGVAGSGGSGPGALASLAARFAGLSQALNTPPAWLALLLVAPYLGLVGLAAAGAWRGGRLPYGLLLLATLGAGYLSWWLIFTPMNRIWLRRVINGVLLHEIVAAIVLSLAFELLLGRGLDGRAAPVQRTLRRVAAAVALVVTAAAGAFTWRNLGDLEVRTRPSDERVAAERIGALIRRLPDDAVIYGKGWWQAPVVSFFAGRPFEDLDWVPHDLLERSLDDRYFVADEHLTTLAGDQLRDILARMDSEPVESVASHSLYRVRRIYPYAPIVFGAEPDVREQVNVAEGSYPYVSGLHAPVGGSRWAKRAAGVVLDGAGGGCLRAQLFFPDISQYPGGRLGVVIEVDDQRVLAEEVSAGGGWERVIPVPPAAGSGGPPGSAREIEVAIDNWWRPAVGNFAQTGFLVSEVGFLECPQQGNGPSAAPAAGGS